MTKIGIAVLATVILFVFLMALRTWRRAMDHKRYLEQNMKASKASFAQAMAEHEKRTAGNLHKVPSPSKPEGMQLTDAERQARQKMEEESRRRKDPDSSVAQSPSAWQTPDATTAYVTPSDSSSSSTCSSSSSDSGSSSSSDSGSSCSSD